MTDFLVKNRVLLMYRMSCEGKGITLRQFRRMCFSLFSKILREMGFWACNVISSSRLAFIMVCISKSSLVWVLANMSPWASCEDVAFSAVTEQGTVCVGCRSWSAFFIVWERGCNKYWSHHISKNPVSCASEHEHQFPAGVGLFIQSPAAASPNQWPRTVLMGHGVALDAHRAIGSSDPHV